MDDAHDRATSGVPDAPGSRLYLDFCGEEHTLEPGSVLTFGRDGDLRIDDNPYLHRVVGVLHDPGGGWWLANAGSTGSLQLCDTSGPSRTVLAPGAACGIGVGEFTIGFRAGPTRYEVLGSLESHELAVDLFGPEGPSGTSTLDWGRVELNDDQRLLLVAMCEARLLRPGATGAPLITNREGAARLGWSLPKYNRKLDHLCEKLRRAGIDGVAGAAGTSAADRRARLVDHALEVGLVTSTDLALLDPVARSA